MYKTTSGRPTLSQIRRTLFHNDQPQQEIFVQPVNISTKSESVVVPGCWVSPKLKLFHQVNECIVVPLNNILRKVSWNGSGRYSCGKHKER